jgi:hypothetical protein
MQFHDVGVIQLPEDLNLPIGALRVSRMLKSIEYLL